MLTCTLCALMPLDKAWNKEEGRTRRRGRYGMGVGPGLSVEEFLNAHFHRTESYPFFNAPDADEKEVLEERQYASSAKVFLQPSPACADMWKEARELIPRGRDKDFLIVYVPKGTGQPKMYADTFYVEKSLTF